MRGSIPTVLELGAGDGQRVLLVDGRSSQDGRMDPQGLERLPGELRPLLSGGADREASRRFGALFDEPAMTELRSRIGWLRSQADAARVPLRVLVDARTPALRALPWELLEEARGLPVAQWLRVLPVDARAPFAHSGAGRRYVTLEVVLWSAEAEDPMVRGLLVRMDSLVRGISGVNVVLLPREAARMAPTPPSSTFRVVHVVGKSLPDLGSGGPPLEGAGLVFLDLLGVDPTEAFASVLQQGVPAVVGLASEPDASIAFARALYQALLLGHDVVDATGEGRKALRTQPRLRFWAPRLMVASPATVTQPAPLRRHPLPGTWPAAAADADDVLDQAVELASGSGFLGVEHLAAAVVRHGRPSPVVSLSLPCLQLVSAMLVPTESDGRLRLTPRMEALVRRLHDNFTLEELVAQVLAVPWVTAILGESTARRIRELAPPGRPVSADEPTEVGGPVAQGLAMEVTGGPDDGRILVLSEPDQILGRWDPSVSQPSSSPPKENLPPQVTNPVSMNTTLYPGMSLPPGISRPPPDDRSRLFLGGRVVERTVSRRHMSFVPPHSVRITAPTQRLNEQGSEVLSGVVELRHGDRLLLGIGTRLMVLG